MSSSIFSSSISEHRWVNQFNEHFVIFVDNHASIFRVPKIVCDTKPEAYAPLQIGLGAYHHLRPDLDEMESKKLDAVKKYLRAKHHEYKNFKSLIVDKVKVLEPSIRSCYNKYLDLDGDTLAWIMSIDGVYLLHLLSTYSGNKGIDVKDRNLAQDVLMLENQIPAIVLKEIKKALEPPAEDEKNDEEGSNDGEDEDDEEDEEEEEDEDDEDEDEDEDEEVEIKDEKESHSEFLPFCEAHTPLELTHKPKFVNDTSSPHLLSYMHNLIVQNWSIGDPIVKSLDEIAGTVQKVLDAGAKLTGLQHLMFLASLPLQNIAALFKRDTRGGNSSIEEIQIPSVSELHKVAKVNFEVWSDSGIGIRYDGNGRILQLPVITLDTDSEVILRNLVAYEVASAPPGSTLAGYVDFMCGIIDTAKDIDLLKDKGIIKTTLPSEEIAKIFNGISKSSSQKTDLEWTTGTLNTLYDSTFRVKAWRFTRDHFVPSESAVKIFLAALLIALVTLQAFCQVYGCSARWFGKISSI